MIDSVTPLEEDGEAPRILDYTPQELDLGDPDDAFEARRLRAVAGPDQPYIWIVPTPETTRITFSGFPAEEAPAVLREVAKLIQAQLPPPPAFGPLR